MGKFHCPVSSKKTTYAGADPGEVKWVNFHPTPPPFSEPPFLHRPQTPQPGFGSFTLLHKFTPHFKILDPRLIC